MRAQLIEELETLLDRQGKAIAVSPNASDDDIRWMIRDNVVRIVPDYTPSGVHTQIGGNRVQQAKGGGLVIRPRYDPRRIKRIDKTETDSMFDSAV